MSSNSLAIAMLATAKLKMKMLPAGFLVALCSTAIQFSDRRSNRSFLLLRIADFVVDVDVLDVSEIPAFPPGNHLAFLRHYIYIYIYILGIIVSSPIFPLHNVFLSFLNLRSNLQLNHRMIFCPILCANLPRLR